jgi:FSR family fosmidomycin resistance protein-like MFS transporter
VQNINRIPLYPSFIVIWLGHLILDFLLNVWPVFKILAELDLAKAGLIAGIGVFIGESSQIFFGFLSDRGHHKKLIILGVLLTSCMAFLAYAESYFLLFFIVLLAYVGAGAFHPAAAGMVGSWSTTRKGLFLTLFSSGGMVGSAISQSAFSKSFEFFNGHTIIFLIPVVFIMIGFYFHSFPAQKIGEKKVNLKRMLKWIKPQKKELLTLYFTQVCTQSLIVAFLFLLPDILRLRNFESWFCLGGAHCFFVLGAASMSVPAGYFADRYSPRRVMIIAVLGSVLGFYSFLLAGPLHIWMTAILLFGVGASMGVLNPVIVAAGNSLVPVHASSVISASLMGGASCLAGFGIIAAGFLPTLFTHEPPVQALQLIGILYILVIFLIFQLRSKPQESEVTKMPSTGETKIAKLLIINDIKEF